MRCNGGTLLAKQVSFVEAFAQVLSPGATAVVCMVQPKAVMFPTDAKLLNRAQERLVRLAAHIGVELRQSYAPVGKLASGVRQEIRQDRYTASVSIRTRFPDLCRATNVGVNREGRHRFAATTTAVKYGNQS